MRSTATPLLVLLMAGASALAASPASHPTTHPATIQEAKAAERQDMLKSNSDTPAIGPYEMPQVLQIRIENKRLVITSPLESFDGERLVKFHHPDDGATIDFHAMTASPAPDQPRMIQFFRYDFRDPNIVFVHSSVIGHPGYAQIGGTWQYLEGMKDVNIIDQEERPDDTGGQTDASTTLRVQGFDDNGNVTHKIDLTAPDFRTLQRNHPAEVNEYLRPVLRELGCESLLDVDPTVAWQVFSKEAHPDPKIMARVHELLPQLDAANFADREQAADTLKNLGPAAAIALLQVDRSKLSAEQNARLEDILSAYQQLPPLDAERLGQDPSFLLSALDSDDPELRRVALSRLKVTLNQPISFDLSSPPDARRLAVDTLRKKLLPPAATQAIEKPAP